MDLKNMSFKDTIELATDPSTPVKVLRDLVKDEYQAVRWNVAENPKSSIKLLVMQFEYEKSFRYPQPAVISALYHHKNLPAFAKSIIETLFGDML